jgi:hypothetical protein
MNKSEKVVNRDTVIFPVKTSQPRAGKDESINKLLWIRGQQQVGMKRFGKMRKLLAVLFIGKLDGE